MTLIMIAVGLIEVVALIVLVKLVTAVGRSWNDARNEYKEALEIKVLRERSNEILVACQTIGAVAERVTQQARAVDSFAAKAVELGQMFEGQTDYVMDVLTNHAVDTGHQLSDTFMKMIRERVESTIMRTLPEILMTKVGSERREYVLCNTLDGFSVDVDLTLKHLPSIRFRKALVRALSTRPITGKPAEIKAAQRYIDSLLGSNGDFEEFLLEFGQGAMEESFKGDLVFQAVPAARSAVRDYSA